MELGRELGISEWSMRNMIEGKTAPLRGIVYAGTARQYFDRDAVIKALFQQPAMAS